MNVLYLCNYCSEVQYIYMAIFVRRKLRHSTMWNERPAQPPKTSPRDTTSNKSKKQQICKRSIKSFLQRGPKAASCQEELQSDFLMQAQHVWWFCGFPSNSNRCCLPWWRVGGLLWVFICIALTVALLENVFFLLLCPPTSCIQCISGAPLVVSKCIKQSLITETILCYFLLSFRVIEKFQTSRDEPEIPKDKSALLYSHRNLILIV